MTLMILLTKVMSPGAGFKWREDVPTASDGCKWNR